MSSGQVSPAECAGGLAGNPYNCEAKLISSSNIRRKPPSQRDYYSKTAVRAGQTGSGKSHTLIGGERGLAEQRGVVPRAVEALWQGIAVSQQVRGNPRHFLR